MLRFLKVLLVVSPIPITYLFGYIYNKIASDPGNMAAGIYSISVVVFGIPFIAITGLLVGSLLRKKDRSKAVSLYGYSSSGSDDYLRCASTNFLIILMPQYHFV